MAEPCGGCSFHEYPYQFNLGNIFSGKNELVEIKSPDDVWAIIGDIQAEGDKLGVSDHVTNIHAHLPLFACKNAIYDKNAQDAISKYLYCEKFGVAPYEGGYGKQPKKWVDTSFVIRNALATKEALEIKNAKNKK